jgi:subtilisin family serine protease
MTLRVFDDSENKVYNLQEAIKYAVDNGAKIINMSFGSNEGEIYDRDFDSYFRYAYDR